jgi:hypothetical protein
MNNEEYHIVNLEVASKLKEKGFNGKCQSIYEDGNLLTLSKDYYEKVSNNKGKIVLAPNYTIVQDWFEDNFDIEIRVQYLRIHDKYVFYIEKKSTGKALIDSLEFPLYLNKYTAFNNAFIEACKLI